MPAMTQAEIAAARHRLASQYRGSGVIARSDPAPEMELVAKPQRVEMEEPPPPRSDEPVSLKLHQFTGEFALPRRGERAGGAVRAVTETDIEELLSWAVPRWVERHPRCTREGMLPLIRLAIQGGSYKCIRTDHACGLFVFVRTPWEPLGTVVDIGVVGNDAAESMTMVVHEVVRIYRAGLDWARELKAAEFRFIEDMGYDLTAIAKRVGMDMEDRVVLYRKKLI